MWLDDMVSSFEREIHRKSDTSFLEDWKGSEVQLVLSSHNHLSETYQMEGFIRKNPVGSKEV